MVTAAAQIPMKRELKVTIKKAFEVGFIMLQPKSL